MIERGNQNKDRFVASLLANERETPAFIDHEGDAATVAPRLKIRAYLHELAAAIGETLPEGWPAVSAIEQQALRGRLQGALEQLYAYIERQEQPEKQRRDAKIGLRLLGESALALLRLDWEAPAGAYEAAPETLSLLAKRPFPQLSLDQLYCTPDSSERRARATLRELPPSGGKVLFLGDDDLSSLVLGSLYDGEIHAMDFDQRLLDHIQETNPAIQCHKQDLVQGGLPKAFCGTCDAVLLDPPWDAYGAWNFIDKAILALKPEQHARILLSFCPVYIEHIDKKMAHFWQKLAKRGMTCERIDQVFHLYSLDGTEFSMLIQHVIPTIESPLLDTIRKVPYGFSHLYTLRRLVFAPKHPIADAWRRFWHTES